MCSNVLHFKWCFNKKHFRFRIWEIHSSTVRSSSYVAMLEETHKLHKGAVVSAISRVQKISQETMLVPGPRKKEAKNTPRHKVSRYTRRVVESNPICSIFYNIHLHLWLPFDGRLYAHIPVPFGASGKT